MNEFWTSWQPKVLSLLRFMSGFLMLWHGTQKLFNYPPTERGAASDPFMIVGGIIEFVGGVLLTVGLFTRWTAFILSGTMAVAYWMFHGLSGKGFLPIQGAGNGGELAALYCFVYLYIFFAGGGSISVDNAIKKNW